MSVYWSVFFMYGFCLMLLIYVFVESVAVFCASAYVLFCLVVLLLCGLCLFVCDCIRFFCLCLVCVVCVWLPARVGGLCAYGVSLCVIRLLFVCPCRVLFVLFSRVVGISRNVRGRRPQNISTLESCFWDKSKCSGPKAPQHVDFGILFLG